MAVILPTLKPGVSTGFSFTDKILNLQQPQVMAILNITPNSFSSIGRCLRVDDALFLAEQMLEEGAHIIDIGGEATNPGVHPMVSVQQELERVVPVVNAIAQRLDIIISVDTGKPAVIKEVVQAGAHLINDQRALRLEGALEAVADAKVPVCLMHMLYPEGLPPKPQLAPYPKGVVNHVKQFLEERVQACLAAGISASQIIIDPGIGGGSFGKTPAEDLSLLRDLKVLQSLGLPILIGTSRKSFIGHLLNLPVEERLPASLATVLIAALNGANILRVHDVKATREVLHILKAIEDPITFTKNS